MLTVLNDSHYDGALCKALYITLHSLVFASPHKASFMIHSTRNVKGDTHYDFHFLYCQSDQKKQLGMVQGAGHFR